jgi:hypothetical protein
MVVMVQAVSGGGRGEAPSLSPSDGATEDLRSIGAHRHKLETRGHGVDRFDRAFRGGEFPNRAVSSCPRGGEFPNLPCLLALVAASFPTCRVFKADSISSKLVAAGVEGFGQLPVAVRFQNTLQDHSVIGVGTQISRSAGRKSRAEQDRLDGKFFREINAGSAAAT